MGFQGPLTAQALGRSPYDEVFRNDPDVDANDGNEHSQEYDHRGRPINPETKRRARDIVRAHNEVMLVVGVAEPDNPYSGPEAEMNARHGDYEEGIGGRLYWAAKRCVTAAGVFGVNGVRQRILIYRTYSEIPCWDLYRAARAEPQYWRTLLRGAPVSLFSNYLERQIISLWPFHPDEPIIRRCVREVWSYVRVHLELYAAFQRLGLVTSSRLLPPLKYFVPFTADSPIPAPPALEDLHPLSVLCWWGKAVLASTPFFVWVMTQRMIRDWKPIMWLEIISRLPNPLGFRPPRHDSIPPPPRSPLLPPPPPPEPETASDGHRQRSAAADGVLGEDVGEDFAWNPDDGPAPNNGPEPDGGGEPSNGPEPTRRPSTFSAAGMDEYGSDEEDSEMVGATLISFDVEATEAADVPQGLWSAELRPSVATDPRSMGVRTPKYYRTMLIKLPFFLAANIFNESLIRLLIAPYEAIALRLAARLFCVRNGLPYSHIFSLNILSGLNMTWLGNFLGTEMLHLAIHGEIWATFVSLSQYFHMTPEAWKDHDHKDWGFWATPFEDLELIC